MFSFAGRKGISCYLREHSPLFENIHIMIEYHVNSHKSPSITILEKPKGRKQQVYIYCVGSRRLCEAHGMDWSKQVQNCRNG